MKNLSEKAAPLTDLLKMTKSMKVLWNEECEEALTTSKEALTEAPVLHITDHSLPFKVQTDASEKAVGAVLRQRHDGKEHPVAFHSKKLTLFSQQRWSTVEQELFTVVSAVEHF